MSILPLITLLAAPAAAADIDFDRGRLDVPAIVRELKDNAKAARSPEFPRTPPKPQEGKVHRLLPEGVSAEAAGGAAIRPQSGMCRNDTDCVEFVFDPGDKESEAIWLRSTEYREDCRYDPRGSRDCWCVPSFTNRVKVQVRIPQRKEVFPWERERFRMCLDDRWVYYDELAIAYEYDAKFIRGTGTVEAIPKQKVAMRPDSEGLTLDSFGLDAASGNYRIAIRDRWKKEYAAAGGETTSIRLKLKRDAFLTDPTVADITFSAPPLDIYEVAFAPTTFKEQLKEKSKYYVEWSFQRLGKVSTDKVIDKDDTSKVEYRKTKTTAGL